MKRNLTVIMILLAITSFLALTGCDLLMGAPKNEVTISSLKTVDFVIQWKSPEEKAIIVDVKEILSVDFYLDGVFMQNVEKSPSWDNSMISYSLGIGRHCISIAEKDKNGEIVNCEFADFVVESCIVNRITIIPGQTWFAFDFTSKVQELVDAKALSSSLLYLEFSTAFDISVEGPEMNPDSYRIDDPTAKISSITRAGNNGVLLTLENPLSVGSYIVRVIEGSIPRMGASSGRLFTVE